MSNHAPKTGRVNVRSGISTPEGKSTYGSLQDLLASFNGSDVSQALQDQGLELLQKDTLKTNLDLANNQIADATAAQDQNLTRSLLSRGVGDSGFATSELLASGNDIRGKLINDAIARSNQENIQNKAAGAELLKTLFNTKQGFAGLLSEFVTNMLSSGISGQASGFATRAGSRSSALQSLTGVLGSGLNKG